MRFDGINDCIDANDIFKKYPFASSSVSAHQFEDAQFQDPSSMNEFEGTSQYHCLKIPSPLPPSICLAFSAWGLALLCRGEFHVLSFSSRLPFADCISRQGA